MAAKSPGKKRKIKKIAHGVFFIHSTFNNTIVSLSDRDGMVLAWSSGGSVGFKGAKKGTPFAAQQATEVVVKRALDEFGVKTVEVKTKGPGSGRDPSIRTIQSAGFKVVSIEDVTPLPHNGCRPPKQKRG
ncbi:MAG: 30S ribosomal protein S11 [bacterium]